MPSAHPAIDLPRLIAHRGLSAHAPENTLSAVDAAAAAGCTWVELDVQLLGDGTPVIWHDANTVRCADANLALADTRLAEARRLDVGRWFSPAFTGERLATLDAMLERIATLGLGLNLELKLHPRRDPAALVAAALPPLLDALPAERVIVSSFDAAALDHARRFAGPQRLALGALFDTLPHDWAARCQALDAYSVHTNWKHLSAAQAQAVRAAGYRLLCYTVNAPQRFAPRWAWGVDAVFSDDPARFAGHLPRD